MNTRKDPLPSSHPGRIKKTTKPSATEKKSEVFDFYNTLEETARLTSDSSPTLNLHQTREIPNLHEEPNYLSPQDKEENKIKPTSPTPRRSYLQSTPPLHSRYHSFKYLQRLQQSSSSKEQINSDSNPSSNHFPPQPPTPMQDSVETEKQPSSDDPPRPKEQDHLSKYQPIPPKNINQENPTQKQPEKTQSAQPHSNPMNTSIRTPLSTNSPSSTDFRENIRRQSSEQKSISRILTIISISFAALIVACFSLAIYGGYVMWSRLNEQSATIADVEKKFASRVSTLQASIDRLQIDLHRTQKYSDELARQNQEITRAIREQQEIARRNKAQIDTLSNQLRQEKAIRDQQIRDLTRELGRYTMSRALPTTPATSINNRLAERPSSISSTTVRR